MGETKALTPLAKRFEGAALSAVTQTGYEEGVRSFGKSSYLPFELFLPFWAPKASLLVVMEAELWPMLFISAKLRGAKTALINARISDRSYPKYKKFAFFYRFIFSFVDAVFAQSEVDKKRLTSLGAKNVFVVGNIKQSISSFEVKKIPTDEKRNFTLASSHEGEEAVVAEAFWRAGLFGANRLVVVPRHPERFEAVKSYLKEFANSRSLSFAAFSENKSLLADIVVVDKIGELVSVYAHSYLVVLGGAFAKIGGHNPIEPSYFGVKLISGKHIFNQQTSFEKVANSYFCDEQELMGLLAGHENLCKSSLKELGDPLGETEKGLRELLCG